MTTRKAGYPSDATDDEWAFLAPYLTLVKEDATQRVHSLRAVFNAVRYVVRTGVQWRMLPNDLPPWDIVYQQARRWIAAGVFEAAAQDLREIMRLASGKEVSPTAVILDGRTLQSTPESGSPQRAGFNGAKKKKGSKVHIAVDTLGNLLALRVTPANEQERAQAGALAKDVQEVTGSTVTLAYVDQGYTGAAPREAAAAEGIELEVVKHTEAKRGFVLLPRRWVVERTFAWLGRSRRLARDYERLSETVAGWHWLAMLAILLKQVAEVVAAANAC
ncbi:MAG TPA: IS5 family transposase [Pirellulales bacterium]